MLLARSNLKYKNEAKKIKSHNFMTCESYAYDCLRFFFFAFSSNKLIATFGLGEFLLFLCQIDDVFLTNLSRCLVRTGSAQNAQELIKK